MCVCASVCEQVWLYVCVCMHALCVCVCVFIEIEGRSTMRNSASIL
jgi:hypothetical protein